MTPATVYLLAHSSMAPGKNSRRLCRLTFPNTVSLYIGLSAVVWTAYFTIRHFVDYIDNGNSPSTAGWPTNAIVSTAVCAVGLLCSNATIAIAIITGVLIIASSLNSTHVVLDSVKFAWITELLMLIYVYLPIKSERLTPVPFWICSTSAVSVSIAFELLAIRTHCLVGSVSKNDLVSRITGRVLLHISAHVIGAGTGQELTSRLTSARKNVRQTANDIIESLMPHRVARCVIRHLSTSLSGENVRPFHWFAWQRVDNVSILFADIVGFTSMCEGQAPENIVRILGEIYGRFDVICSRTKVEPIGTLGDCYYCVAGFPRSARNHAIRAVQTGLEMCNEITNFHYDIDMRIGIHTGSVLCGVFGKRCIRFDIFSHDVTIANMMESTGTPGRVHVSDSTYQLVRHHYSATPGECYSVRHAERAMPTWFVDGVAAHNSFEHHPFSSTVTDVSTPSVNQLGYDSNMSSHNNHIQITDSESSTDDDDDSAAGNSKCPKSIAKLMPSSRCVNVGDLESEDDDCRTINNNSIIFFFVIHLLVVAFCIGTASSSVADRRIRPLWSELGLIFGVSLVTCCILMSFAALFGKICIRQPASSTQLQRFILQLLGVLSLALPPVAIVTYSAIVKDRDFNWLLATVIVALCHYTNYTTIVSSTVKTLAVVVTCILSIVSDNLQRDFSDSQSDSSPNVWPCGSNNDSNSTDSPKYVTTTIRSDDTDSTAASSDIWKSVEFALTVSSAGLLVWLINRRLETRYRMRQTARVDQVQLERLIRIIVPDHLVKYVLLQLDHQRPFNYSRNIPNAGVVFANISNFDLFYDETFRGGLECLRYLNELFVDFEKLLEQQRYAGRVEKIKAIGTSLMVASGIHVDGSDATAGDGHVDVLADYVADLGRTLDRFNETLLSDVPLKMKVGLNCGPLTAGVMGTSRTMFDIWGGTVNVASRMCSTGLDGHLQVSSEARAVLRDGLQFERRENVFVKGIGITTTFMIPLATLASD